MGESISDRTKTIKIRPWIGNEGIFDRFDLEIGGEGESVLRIKYLIIGNYSSIILTRIVNHLMLMFIKVHLLAVN